MRTLTLALACASLFVLSSSAGAVTVGGTDETTEDFTTASWAAAAAATPGTVAGGVTGSHLLLSEIGMRGVNTATAGDSTEFLEIYNPTASTIDLTTYYICDVNAYATLPVAGTIDLAANNTDYAMRFPAGSTIAPGQAKVIAVDGGRFKRGAGLDADFEMFNAGGATTAQMMTDVGTNKGGSYPGFGSLTNAGEFVWLFRWDGTNDLVCDVDFVYWGPGTGANLPTLKSSSLCQDGPDGNTSVSCYLADAGPLTKALVVPASGTGTRQRATAESQSSATGGNGCSDVTPPPAPMITSGPTVTPDTTFATIVWTTDIQTNGRVYYGLTSSYGDAVVQTPLTTSHSITLTNLAPVTLYHYKVACDSLGDSTTTGDLTFSTITRAPGVINVYFNHSIDSTYARGVKANGNADLASLIINRINSATYSVDCAFYSFQYPAITDALISAFNRGVKVRFIMDAGNSQSEMNRLVAAGIPCIVSTFGGNHGSGIMHNKFMILDGRDQVQTNDWLWTGSTNVTTTGINTDAQNAVEIKDYLLAQCYTTEFNEMWGSSTDTPDASNAKMGNHKTDNTPHSFTVNGVPVEQYMSPSDNTESHIVDAINTLTTSALFCILSFTQDSYENAFHAVGSSRVDLQACKLEYSIVSPK